MKNLPTQACRRTGGRGVEGAIAMLCLGAGAGAFLLSAALMLRGKRCASLLAGQCAAPIAVAGVCGLLTKKRGAKQTVAQ